MPVLLVRARITNYRSIEDSGKFAIESDVTALVGKNESGKTAGLQALYRVSPVDSSAVFDEVIDFPSRLTRQRKQARIRFPRSLPPSGWTTTRSLSSRRISVRAPWPAGSSP